MRAEERDREDSLIDILDSIEKIESFIEGFEFEDFSADDKTIYAVILKDLPDSLKLKHPEVPWREISGLRDKMVYGDFGLDLEAIWNIAVEYVSSLKPLIVRILNER